ncbi:hypothetical protein [Spirosoma validum]|uniref:Uncharacterized protein n=1 Tax=Spirosoma validum TaxID=2771355 RepID=A0A927B1D0_9BACT|nr:hypothetical protein [Spirosoma validum]MBD2753584.1 hypothetical protein [Spirosoma validum]
MHLNLKPYYWLLLGIVVVFVLIGLIGNVIIPGGINSQFWRKMGPYVVFGLFLLGVASLVPVLLKGFLVAQYKIGNSHLPLVQLINQHSKQVLLTVWVIFGIGMGVALPYMIKDGFFEQAQVAALESDQSK